MENGSAGKFTSRKDESVTSLSKEMGTEKEEK